MDKKAQVAETMTWILATVVIIVILVATLSITGLNETAKKMMGLDKEIKSNTETDLLITKSFMGYLLTDDSGGQIFEQLKDKKTLNEAYVAGESHPKKIKVDTTLPKKIFLELYEEEFAREKILLRISSEWCLENIACHDHRVLLDIGGLPSDKIEKNKFFHDYIKLKNWGHITKNTILELMLN